MILTLHNGNVSAQTTKNSGVSFFVVTENWPGQNTNSKVFFFAKTSTIFGKNEFDFLLHNFSRYGIYRKFSMFFHESFFGDVDRTRVALHTDTRTDIHGGKNNICLPQGKTYNKKIFETKKLKKCQNTTKILKTWLQRCTMGMSSLTLQKPPAILQCIVTEIWTGQNTILFFFAKTSNFLRKSEFEIFVAQLQLVCYLWKWFENFTFKILGDMVRTREALRMDGRTSLPLGETYNYISPPAGDIYRSWLRVCRPSATLPFSGP